MEEDAGEAGSPYGGMDVDYGNYDTVSSGVASRSSFVHEDGEGGGDDMEDEELEVHDNIRHNIPNAQHDEGSDHMTVENIVNSHMQEDGGSKNVEVLRECVQKFMDKDSIMEVGVLADTKRFLAAGGTPQNVVQLLSENYTGYAQMCNLMADWLVQSGMPATLVAEMVKEHLKSIILEKFDPIQADSIFGEMESAPEWLDVMIEHQEWRSLIYQLSEVHPSCLMLNFAIQRISDAGHQTEIASLPTASTNFGVFNRVLTHSLDQMIQLDELGLEGAINDFKKMCCHSQHTYLYTQAVLSSLIKEPNGYHLKRLIQELEKSTLEHGQVTRKLSLLLSDVNKYPNVASSVASILASQATTPGDVIKLHKEYSKPDPPPVEFLRHRDIFDIFIRDMFNPQKKLNPAHTSKYFYVLAYAASVVDTRGISLESGEQGKLDRSEFAATMRALKDVQPICHANSFGSELQAALHQLKDNITYPVVAMGILEWIRSNLTNAANYTATVNALCTPIYLELLREICYRHKLQQAPVLDLLVACFNTDYDLDALATVELKKSLLDTMIYLMQCGCVMPVLHYIQQWTPVVDQGLIRHFIVKLVSVIDPPYSVQFINAMVNIMGTVNVEPLRNTPEKKAIAELIAHCVENQTEYGLDKNVQQVLSTLQNLFSSAPKLKIKLSSDSLANSNGKLNLKGSK